MVGDENNKGNEIPAENNKPKSNYKRDETPRRIIIYSEFTISVL